jgi:hypothetical protein
MTMRTDSVMNGAGVRYTGSHKEEGISEESDAEMRTAASDFAL